MRDDEQRETGAAAGEELRQPGEEENGQDRSVGIVRSEQVRLFGGENKLRLQSGRELGPIDVAYETYGTLNERRDNAILIVHALSGDAHAAGRHSPEDRKAGWWDRMIGPGKPFDTERYFIICSNCLGGCMGTTGPSSVDPATGQTYGLRFPMITISDMVEVQRHLIDHLGIEKLLAVTGGSMGGMQVLDWAIRYPGRVASVIPVATTARLSAQGIAFDAVGRNAILRDENFHSGDYYSRGQYPTVGLAVARMVGHITYLSEEAMHEKFGRRLQDTQDYRFDFANEFSVETYLDYQGSQFVDRFDANTYLYFTKAMDYFDVSRSQGGLEEAFAGVESRFLVLSFASDWLFPPAQSKEIANALIRLGKDVAYCNIDCAYGHDSFLLETKVQGGLVAGFLAQTHRRLREGPGRAEPAGDQWEKELGKWRRERRGLVPRSRSIFSGERVDHVQIERLIRPGSMVLDLGCGNGDLLAGLQQHKNVRGVGITLGQEDVVECTRRGVSVVQYDLHDCLSLFGDKAFDYAVLSQTLPVVRRPEQVIRELLRVANKVIVSFPNFAYWRARVQLLLEGRAPVWKGLPSEWYNKPEESVNYMSIRDFEQFVTEVCRAKVVRRLCLSSRWGRLVHAGANWLADEAIFVITERRS